MEDKGIVATDNVRNIISAYDIEEKKDVTVFMDNFGNVNFTFEGRIIYDMEKDEMLSDIRVLDGYNVLVKLAAGKADYAIIDYAGNIKAYLPEDAKVMADAIIAGEDVYSLGMVYLRPYYTSWASGYIDSYTDGTGRSDPDSSDNLMLRYTVGNALVYTYNYTAYSINEEIPYSENFNGVVIHNVMDDNVTEYEDYVIIDHVGCNGDARSDAFVVIANDNIVKVINGEGECKLTVEVTDYHSNYDNCYDYIYFDGGAIFTFNTPDGYLTVRVDEVENYEEGDYYGK